MAVRSMKLKLKTHSKNNSAGLPPEMLRQGIWKTHELFNQGVAYYMNFLLLIRQEKVGSRSKEEIQQQLMDHIRQQQSRTGEIGEPEDILPALRKMYECIISGNASQSASTWLGRLVDPNTVSGKGISKAGRKPRWMKLKMQGDPRWEEEYQKDKERKQSDPWLDILNTLETYGLQPILHLYTDTREDIQWIPKRQTQVVRKWDKEMFQQAIENIKSWDSWNKNVQAAKAELKQKLDQFREKYIDETAEWHKNLRLFEKQREQELQEESLAPNEPYRILRRQIRGWNEIYKKWSKIPLDAPMETYFQAIAQVQTAQRDCFGDAKVFRFLAQPEQRFIWRDHPNRIVQFTEYNHLLRDYSNAREEATLTLPDAMLHPEWIRFEARGGTNKYKYELYAQSKKKLMVRFDALLMPKPDSSGSWVETKNVTFDLAPSSQFWKQVTILPEQKGKQQIVFTDNSSHIPTNGVLAGAKIQLDRTFLEKCKESELRNGDIGPVYLSIAVDIQPIVDVKNGKLTTPVGTALKYISTTDKEIKVIGFKPEILQKMKMELASPTTSTGELSLTEGFRVMSVDLGIRSSAAISIFELQSAPPSSRKLHARVADTDMVAVHLRSFLLQLPGEKTSKRIELERHKRQWKRQIIRKQIQSLAKILSLHTHQTSEQREKALQSITSTVEAFPSAKFWLDTLETLHEHFHSSSEVWNQALIQTHRTLEPIVGKEVSKWRKSLQEDRRGLFGLSLANIVELEETKRILSSWSKRSRIPGKTNRYEVNERFASNLQKHIQNVKNDRLKQLANLLVMTALGYVYDSQQKKWVERYPACQLILFEDLSRYRFSMDRPRKENSQLMKWAHRSIPKMVRMQAEIYGIQVGDVYSAYTSRFHAHTGAPGIRCHAVTEADLEQVKQKLLETGFLKEKELSLLKPGDIVPWSGGELFVTLSNPYSSDCKLVVLHADINAAQNLQKRFWNQNGEIFRIVCQRVKDESYVPTNKRTRELLGNGKFIKIGNDEVYQWEATDKKRVKKALASQEDVTEAFHELVQGYVTLFRDPSGMFMNKNHWYPQKSFWSRVNAIIQSRLKQVISSREVGAVVKE
jgi:IS605 OrfB family transposase